MTSILSNEALVQAYAQAVREHHDQARLNGPPASYDVIDALKAEILARMRPRR